MMELDQLLLATRVVFYLGIAFMIGVWYRPAPDAEYRVFVSFVATMITGFSLSLGVLNMITWDAQKMATAKELMATGFVGMWFLLTVLSGGNVARLLTKVKGIWN